MSVEASSESEHTAMPVLLTREEFDRKVFLRDDGKCVVCGAPAKDAHHIIDRSLWTSSGERYGYFVENGASVCEKHHKEAEIDVLPPQALRRLIGLPTVIPSELDPSVDYSKWGRPFKMPTRTVAKYPSTSYLDVSPGKHGGNDVIITTSLAGIPVVVTIKMDGANVVLRRDSMGARNGDTANHRSFDMLKSIHAQIRHKIPENVEVFAEWLYAKHSIHYVGELALDSYLNVIAAYDTKWTLWLSWSDTMAIADSLGFVTVPVLCSATYQPWQMLECVTDLGTQAIESGHEGLVVRSMGPFHYGQFGAFVGKYVRDGHVQTDDHWSSGPVVKNEIRAGNSRA